MMPHNSSNSKHAAFQAQLSVDTTCGHRLISPNSISELQTLYNYMRDMEEDVKFESQLRLLQEPASGDEEPRSPSQLSAPGMARSASGRSDTHSLNGALRAVHLGDDHNRIKKKKGKARRSGPLVKDKKARAAFVRKLGACENCHGRKVKCTHYDWSVFEERYRASKAAASRPSSSSGLYRGPSTPVNPATGPPTLTLTIGDAGQSFDQSLFGIGSDLTHDPTQDLSCLPLADIDFDSLLSPSPSLPPVSPVSHSPASSSRPPVPTVAPAPLLGYVPRTWGGNNYLNPDPYLNNLFLQPRTEDICIPIGRCIPISGTLDEYWECQFNREDNASSQGSDSEMCYQPYWTINDLTTHVYRDHVRFRDTCFIYKCKSCQSMWDSNTEKCYQCPNTYNWEKWCYAYVSSTPSVASAQAPAIRVTKEDGSFAKWSAGTGSTGNITGYGFQGGISETYNTSWGGYGNGGRQYHQKGSSTMEEMGLPLEATRSHISKCHVWHIILPCLFTMLLFGLAWSSMDALSPTSHWLSPGQLITKCLAAAADHLSACGILCIVAGIVGTWLVKHVWLCALDSREAPDLGRCVVMRDIFGIKPADDHVYVHAMSAGWGEWSGGSASSA